MDTSTHGTPEPETPKPGTSEPGNTGANRDRVNDHAHDEQERRLDPTKMINQPALRQSSGTIWIVVGGLFLALSLVPFGALIFAGSGRSSTVAAIFASILILLYAALVTSRFVFAKRVWRLRFMAVCMLSMAALAFIGIWFCSLIESAATISAA